MSATELRYAETAPIASVDVSSLGYTSTAPSGETAGSSIIRRADPPREGARVAERLAHLVPDVQRLLDLLAHDSDSTARTAVQATVRLFDAHGDRMIPPSVTALLDGGVHLEWFNRGVGVEIEADPEGRLTVLTDRGGEVCASDVSSLADPVLLEVLPLIQR